jgi:hypothetical protein
MQFCIGVLVVQEVNGLLVQLHKRFAAYLASLPVPPAQGTDSKKEAASLAEMVDEIGHRCLMLQETLQEGTQVLVQIQRACAFLHTLFSI